MLFPLEIYIRGWPTSSLKGHDDKYFRLYGPYDLYHLATATAAQKQLRTIYKETVIELYLQK